MDFWDTQDLFPTNTYTIKRLIARNCPPTNSTHSNNSSSSLRKLCYLPCFSSNGAYGDHPDCSRAAAIYQR